MTNKEITKGLLKGKLIIIDVDFFEHLLNCLANQKYIDFDEEKLSENQKAIDKAYRKGREMINHLNCQEIEI